MAEVAAATSRQALLLTDVVLRAEADGSTAQAHRGILATHSGVFREALAADVTVSNGTLPLPGKTDADLSLLMGYLYPKDARSERFTADNIGAVCALAREYDMPGMMELAETWMIAFDVGQPLTRISVFAIRVRETQILERANLLRLGDTYNLRRFAKACAKQLCKLSRHELRAVVTEYRGYDDEKLQNGKYFLHELVAQMIPKLSIDE
jgi:hypothetical protein